MMVYHKFQSLIGNVQQQHFLEIAKFTLRLTDFLIPSFYFA